MGAPSRPKRFEEAQGHIAMGQEGIEQLRDELQEWLDGMPENLQGGTKADQLQEAIDALEECLDNLEEVANAEVVFPGMFA